MSLLGRRMLMTQEAERDNFTLLETFTITPTESKKYIHLGDYECTEFLIYGEIPKTENTTTFNMGVEEIACATAPAGSNIYAMEMYAHIYKIGDKLVGFVGFESGWDKRGTSALLKSPRITAESATLKVQFYPFVSGDEQAVLKIYGR